MDNLELTSEQKEEILRFWNEKMQGSSKVCPSLKELTIHIFKEELDGRSLEGRAIKDFLATRELKPKTTSEYEKDLYKLSDDHKEYIDNNCQTNSVFDMSKSLFGPTISNLSKETRAIAEYVKTLDKVKVYKPIEAYEIPSGEYEPPKTLDRVIRRINMYTNTEFEKDKITPRQKKNAEMLLKYLHTYRFVKQMNIYDSDSDRKTCEDVFVRFTYDKPELSEEEIDQYIVLANEAVLAFKAQRRSEKLQGMLESISDNSPEQAKFAMSLVLEAWKNEESRRNWIRLAEVEQKAVGDELIKLEGLSEIKAKLMGLSKEEILNS